MTLPRYAQASFNLSTSNATAFKHGKIQGPCKNFQQGFQGKNKSIKQAESLWHK